MGGLNECIACGSHDNVIIRGFGTSGLVIIAYSVGREASVKFLL